MSEKTSRSGYGMDVATYVAESNFIKALSLTDATMLTAGTMIGSGIFIGIPIYFIWRGTAGNAARDTD